MAVKRFYAAQMHTALADIRAQLGDDAVILATRQLSDGVEVSAAVDTDGAISSVLPVKTGSAKATDSGAGRVDPASRAQGGSKRELQQFSKTSADREVSGSGGTARQGNEWYLNSISALEDEQSALHTELGSIRSLLQ